MPLQATSGAASYDAFGGGVPVVPAYIEEVFSAYLYTGTGASQTITNSIDLSTKGGLVWIKARGLSEGIYAQDHSLIDTVRGPTVALSSNLTTGNLSQEYALGTGGTFNSNGFTIASTNPQVNASTVANGYASWTFRKQPKFFDIQTWTGTGSNRTISHSLGSIPGCIMVKRTDTTGAWQVYHRSLGATEYLVLNTTASDVNSITRWNNTTPTSSVFSLGTDATVNASGGTYVAYIFAHNAGGFGLTGTDNVISCGTYQGSGSPQTINLGYEAQFVLIKAFNTESNWWIFDNLRGMPVVGTTPYLHPNLSDAEATANSQCRATSTGFIADGDINFSGEFDVTYIYIAIRRGPMRVPTDATKVFKPLTRTANNALAITTGYGFAPDMMFSTDRSRTYPTSVYDKLRGNFQAYPNGSARYIETSSTGGEANAGNESGIQTFDNNGITFYTDSNGRVNFSGTYVYWIFGRAPSFFDQVCYTGTGANRTVSHNLGAVPELMIVKRRNTSGAWDSYCSALANTEYIVLNTTAAKATGATRWNSTTPTSSVFSVGTSTTTNASGGTYVAYLFATCAGVSKVGSYTGTATTKQIDCGFTGGARFVLIKRTDSTGDWYVWDTARGVVSGNDPYLLLNSQVAEVTSTDYIDTYSAGFEISSTAPAAINASGGTFIFLAIA